MKATRRIMDAVWTLEYRVEDHENITVLSYDHKDREGYDKERELPDVQLVEDANRVVREVWLWEKHDPMRSATSEEPDYVYAVANPGHVFSWLSREKGING